MQEHHPDAIEGNIESHPVKLAIYVVVGAVALIVGIILLVQLAVGRYGIRDRATEKSMTTEAVGKRIAPVAHVAVDPNAPPPSAAPAAPAVAAVAMPAPAKGAAAASNGKATYDASCAACHGAGIAGAPKLGDKAAWAPRLKAGKPALYASAIKGKGAMPPKGGNTALSDADVQAAVDYLTAS